MEIVLDVVKDEGLKGYLLKQSGIKNVEIFTKDCVTKINVQFDNSINPIIVLKYVLLFQDNEQPILLSFNKDKINKYKTLNYLVDDLCCEYCYKSFVAELFKNEYIKSVKSNFDFNKPLFNIEFIIEYDETYNEEELKEYINDSL